MFITLRRSILTVSSSETVCMFLCFILSLFCMSLIHYDGIDRNKSYSLRSFYIYIHNEKHFLLLLFFFSFRLELIPRRRGVSHSDPLPPHVSLLPLSSAFR